MSVPSIPRTEIVTVGDELLLGETVDANAAWLGRRLALIGVAVSRRATVGDDPAYIKEAVRDALDRTGTVLCTGGLGPTRDDVTKEAVADLLGRPLVMDGEVLRRVRERFESRGLEMPQINRKQAEVPEGARVLPNPRGTAPGLVLEDAAGRMTVLLPGVPSEMEALVETGVLGLLERRWPENRRPIRSRVIRTTGLAESALAERVGLADLEDSGQVVVAFLPSPIGVDLRLTVRDLEDGAAASALDTVEARLRERLGPWIYGRDREDLVDRVEELLERWGWTLAVAESCTGGLLAKRLTDRPGASDSFLGGVVAYANDAKQALLGVRARTLETHGAVSEECAREMAEGVVRAFGARAGVSITGVAGPGGGSPGKPVGTVCIAAALPGGTATEGHRFPGDRGEVRDRSAQACLDLLRRSLEGASP